MTEEVVFGSEKRTVVLNLPCIEKPTVYYGKKIETAEARCYTSAKLTPVFTSHTVPIKLLRMRCFTILKRHDLLLRMSLWNTNECMTNVGTAA